MDRAVMLAACLGWSTQAGAQPNAGTRVDRVIARFEAPELGGAAYPRFIFERVLAFEARIEALSEPQRGVGSDRPFDEQHVRTALQNHVTEEILRSLPVDPPVSADEARRRSITVLLMLQQQVGGRKTLLDAAFAEGMEMEELDEWVERRARASLYLERMVAPMINPSDSELRDVLRSEVTPFRGQPYEQVAGPLRRWYMAHRLSEAIDAFFRSARSRIRIRRMQPALTRPASAPRSPATSIGPSPLPSGAATQMCATTR